MKLGMSLSLALSLVTQLSLVARAEDRREEHHDEHHKAARHEEHLPPRAPAPQWRAHPPGGHPAGAGYHPGYHPHTVRVLQPRNFRYGEHPYRHWGHPEFARPAYYWDWRLVHSVSCTAEDSYGDQYPVTESTFAGFGLGNMTAVEDDALDRCYDESGGDPSCYLATCSHF
jgi:hypothetical protein